MTNVDVFCMTIQACGTHIEAHGMNWCEAWPQRAAQTGIVYHRKKGFIQSFHTHLHVHCSPVCCNSVIWWFFVHMLHCQKGKGIRPPMQCARYFFPAGWGCSWVCASTNSWFHGIFFYLKTLSKDHPLVIRVGGLAQGLGGPGGGGGLTCSSVFLLTTVLQSSHNQCNDMRCK